MGRVCFSSCAVQQESPVSGPSSNCCWYLYSQESLATAPILSQQVILLSCLFVLWASPDASTPCPMRQRAPAGITPSCVSACSKWPCSDLSRRCYEHSAFVPSCGSTRLAIRHLFGTKKRCARLHGPLCSTECVEASVADVVWEQSSAAYTIP